MSFDGIHKDIVTQVCLKDQRTWTRKTPEVLSKQHLYESYLSAQCNISDTLGVSTGTWCLCFLHIQYITFSIFLQSNRTFIVPLQYSCSITITFIQPPVCSRLLPKSTLFLSVLVTT